MESVTTPWGSWHVLHEGDGYKVKRIQVSPGSRLSYQTHRQRSEHWVVVAGVATCTLDGAVRVARAGDSVDVPLQSAHRLANLGDEVLVVIEVQRGSYLGEDDICRLEDDYGRDLVGPYRSVSTSVHSLPAASARPASSAALD